MTQTPDRTPQDHPGVVAHPPSLYLGFLVLAWVLDRVVPLPVGIPESTRSLGVLLVPPSLALMIWGRQTMVRAGTNVRPSRPSTALVTGGPFRFSRNPLYVAVTALYLACAWMTRVEWALVLVIPLALIVHYGIVRREERYLEQKFGDDYRAYCTQTRRWF